MSDAPTLSTPTPVKMPQRWDLDYGARLVLSPHGDYVRAYDVTPMLSEIERLRAHIEEIDRLRARVEVLERVRYHMGWASVGIAPKNWPRQS